MMEVKTKVITNFKGNLALLSDGDMNSGLCKYATSYAYEPFIVPNVLHWQELTTQIDSGATVITDLIVRQKTRVESGAAYVYAADYAGKFYKITVSTDSPASLGTTGLNLKYLGGLEFYNGVSEKVYIGNDAGVYKINFDGTSGTAITAGVTWVSNVPRPIVSFLGKLYVGNDTNLVEIGSAETVTSGAKLTTALPANWHIRDLSVSQDGAYLIILASRLPVIDIKTANPVDISSPSETGVFYWNGSDATYSAFDFYKDFIGTSINTSSRDTYMTGQVLEGHILRKNGVMVRSLSKQYPACPDTVGFNGNQFGWATAENDGTTKMKAAMYIYGNADEELGDYFVRPFRVSAAGSNTDVQQVCSMLIVSNLVFQTGSTTPAASAKVYYSTYETGGTPTSRFYKFNLANSSGGSVAGGVYETQNQLFSKKISVVSVRFYVEPTAANNGFQMDLIGIDYTVLSGSTQTYTFAAGSDPLTYKGSVDLIEFGALQVKDTSSLGLRITNTGTADMKFHKVEIDYVENLRR